MRMVDFEGLVEAGPGTVFALISHDGSVGGMEILQEVIVAERCHGYWAFVPSDVDMPEDDSHTDTVKGLEDHGPLPMARHMHRTMSYDTDLGRFLVWETDDVSRLVRMLVSRQKIEALRQTLSDSYDCTRVWGAWSVGTMGPDDFAPLSDDDDRLEEIVEAVVGGCVGRVCPGWRSPRPRDGHPRRCMGC